MFRVPVLLGYVVIAALVLVACSTGSPEQKPATDAAKTEKVKAKAKAWRDCEVPCTSLGAEFAGGRTQCTDDGKPDTTSCRPAADAEEIALVVKPATRDPDKWGTARCNDGTAFGYLLRKTESKTWVIAFEGGFFCDDDKASCAGRKPKLISTLPWDDGAMTGLTNEGVFSRDPRVNPVFHDANLVGAQYCSSDLWTGESTERRPTQGDPDGWYFSGRINARALLASLLTQGLDDADPQTRVLVVGHSAGGAGVVANLDQILATLPKTSKDGRLKLILDGSWVPPQKSDARLPNGAKWGALHPQCDADLRKKAENPAHCVYGTTWWPYVAKTGVPVLVQIAGLDATQLPVFDVRGPDAQQEWKTNLLKSLEGVPWLFTGGHRYHTLALDAGWAQGPENQTFRDLVGRFWQGAPPERLVLGYDAPANGGSPQEPAADPAPGEEGAPAEGR